MSSANLAAWVQAAWQMPNACRRYWLIERDGAVGQAVLYVRAEDGVGRRNLFDAFPPVLAGFEVQHGFAL